MYGFLYKPKETLKKVVKFGYLHTILYLILGLMLWLFAVKIQGATWLASLYVLLGALILVLLGSLVLNVMLLALNKDDYLKSLLTLVVPWFMLSKVAFLASLLALIPSVGIYLVALLLLFALPFIMIVQLRIFTDMFKTDMLTALVILFVLGFGTTAGFATILGAFATQFVGKIGFGLLPSLI